MIYRESYVGPNTSGRFGGRKCAMSPLGSLGVRSSKSLMPHVPRPSLSNFDVIRYTTGTTRHETRYITTVQYSVRGNCGSHSCAMIDGVGRHIVDGRTDSPTHHQSNICYRHPPCRGRRLINKKIALIRQNIRVIPSKIK